MQTAPKRLKTSNISDTAVSLNIAIIIRNDRSTGDGEGAAIISSSLKSRELSVENAPNFEMV